MDKFKKGDRVVDSAEELLIKEVEMSEEIVFGEDRAAVVELISHAETLGFDVSRDGELWSLRDRRNHQTAVSGSIQELRRWLDDGGLEESESSIHHWFELTYAQYLTVPRSILQAMPMEWQHRFVQCLEELDDTYDWRPFEGFCYRVSLNQINGDRWNEDYWGDEIMDPLASYRCPNQEEIRRRKRRG